VPDAAFAATAPVPTSLVDERGSERFDVEGDDPAAVMTAVGYNHPAESLNSRRLSSRFREALRAGQPEEAGRAFGRGQSR